MKSDIESRADIERLVRTFYDHVHREPKLAPIFDMPAEAFEKHLSRTCDFWEGWLLQSGNYDGGMMWVHMQKHREHPLTADLFERWLALWFLSVDMLFEGQKATFAKNKALEVGQTLHARLNRA